MDFVLIARINLVLQLATVAILAAGFLVKRRGKIREHGLMMAVGMALNMASFLLVMGPSLYSLSIGGSLFRDLPSNTSIVVILHAGIGSVAMVLGTWIVAAWGLRRDLRYCVKRKMAMSVTFLLWSTALLLGIVLFMWLYQ